jgi:hypothetical protein
MLLHDPNDGWTVPYPYLMVCLKNIYLRIVVEENLQLGGELTVFLLYL